ncbi:hypothetical protein PVAND_011970 [Polypedilum vanderplanki]|uniref:BTB domain-containing protein n=1 Tax=Polypedilum vanderplanki TaxID=319348 RepID=A0A9J6CKX5_POLVA|nr:hypothetical protein PVAND_011970 [Polypedilum vanderplanki]
MGDKMFSSLFDKFLPFEELRDFTFIVDGKPYKVHRVVFAARSPAFARIFKANQKEYTIDDLSQDIFEEIVKFAYSENIEITDKNERPLLAAAERFEIREIINAINLHRNLKIDPIKKKELEAIKLKYDEISYLYKKTVERNSVKNPFSQLPSRFY